MNNSSTRTKENKSPNNVCSCRRNMKSILKHRETSIDRSYIRSLICQIFGRMLWVRIKYEHDGVRSKVKPNQPTNQPTKIRRLKLLYPALFTRSYYTFTTLYSMYNPWEIERELISTRRKSHIFLLRFSILLNSNTKRCSICKTKTNSIIYHTKQILGEWFSHTLQFWIRDEGWT